MSETKKKGRHVPLWSLLVCLIAVASMFSYIIYAEVTSFHNTKPYIGELLFDEPEMQIDAFTFTYDSYTQTYTEANVGVRNIGTVQHSGSLNIYLYDQYGVKIAEGIQNTGLVGPQSTVGITVTITWVIGCTVANLTNGNFQLITTS